MIHRKNYQNRIRLKRNEQRYATHYGGSSSALRSLEEVAKILGCSRQAVHQIERTAFHKIRLALLPILKEINPQLSEELCEPCASKS